MPAAVRRKARQRGSEVIEFTLVMIPMLGLMMMIIDVAWMAYVRGTLMYAAQNGARFAMANRVDRATGNDRTDAAELALTVAEMRYRGGGLLQDTPVCTYDASWNLSPPTQTCLSVLWYDPTGPGGLTTPVAMNGRANQRGNVVVASVNGYSMSPLLAIFYGVNAGGKWNFRFANVASSDRMD